MNETISVRFGEGTLELVRGDGAGATVVAGNDSEALANGYLAALTGSAARRQRAVSFRPNVGSDIDRAAHVAVYTVAAFLVGAAGTISTVRFFLNEGTWEPFRRELARRSARVPQAASPLPVPPPG